MVLNNHSKYGETTINTPVSTARVVRYCRPIQHRRLSMKTTEHVEYLLRQGRKPKELVELGFPKQVVTRVRRQLREEREPRKVTAKEVIGAAKDQPQSPAPSVQPPTRILEILTTLDAKYGELLDRLSAIEAVDPEALVEHVGNFL